ncbi:hypothetical protein Ga0074812_14917 [Parafrankia irregularis]|uniref:Uncharacterized protein n=1 Tax=Parafrankia irregularis TaxID=795642 RepID=A0A0S4R093_9ACTN|nr:MULTISPECIES: hypothetical protein [Frankiaceae]KPM50301.1 hypothetical protein ACG83_40890 [Frankia sp. R43]MBE3204722.1 hypothetical protein [Parafrankia sp. CH37]CUU60873.1 hypothetical protein Ga0074812_14917 [Parafrankia irregularis]
MTSSSEGRVGSRLNPDGTFTVTVWPGAPRDAIVHGLLTVPAGTGFAGTPAHPHRPAVLLLTPPGGDSMPAAAGWVPRIPLADAAVEVDAIEGALTTLLAAAALELPDLARRPETRALHDALGRLLRPGPDGPPPWRVPRPR